MTKLANICRFANPLDKYSPADGVKKVMIRMQVMICTLGPEGMARIDSAHCPRVEGVEYVVCWQTSDPVPAIPESLRTRPDFRILTHDSRGVSRNRNFALRHATAPLMMMGDDDMAFSASGLGQLMDVMESHPDIDIAATRYLCRGEYVKPYPPDITPAGKAPKGWYISAVELAMRPDRVRASGVWFNENISLGTPVLRCGEEEVFLTDALRHSLNVAIVPVEIGSHDSPGTGERDRFEPYCMMTQGACLQHRYPLSWLPRLGVRALRLRGLYSPLKYVRHALRGILYARRHKVFKSFFNVEAPSGEDHP